MSDDSTSVTWPLAKPIKLIDRASGETLEERASLTFREPTAGDIVAVGNPVVMDMAADPPTVSHDERKMTAMMARLAGITPIVINQMGPKDWVGCAWLLTPFFVPTPGTI